MITVTDTASKKIKQNLQRRGHGIGIRLGIRTTGCSGLAYVLEYVNETFSSDIAYDMGDFVVVTDPKSLTLLQDVEIDYVRQGLNEGFEFRNRAEKDRCGCGESFRV
jgi:iron-sulfur cluster assembly protein